MEASITLKKVGKLIDDKTIVAGLTFGIERGSLVAIIGANDTGKSVLLKVRALMHNPEILVLDEPTGFMDAPSVRLTWDLLKRLKGDKSIIYVSNALPEVEQAHDRILVFRDGKIIMDGSLDKLLESTLDYHQFQIEFDNLSDDLYKSLSNVATVVSPSRINNIFHFYGRERSVFFDIVREASDSFMIDLSVKKLGLRDLMDSEFAGGGLD